MFSVYLHICIVYISLSGPSPIIAFPCHSVSHSYSWILLKLSDMLKMLHVFVKVVLCISGPLPNKNKLKFDQDFKAWWSFCFELKVLNESKYSMPWVRCAFGNVLILPGVTFPKVREGVLSFNSQIVLAITFLSKRFFGNNSFFKVNSPVNLKRVWFGPLKSFSLLSDMI